MGNREPRQRAERAWRAFDSLAATLAVALLFVIGRPAIALEARDLAGWWLAIDRVFPQLYETGRIVPMEELLVVANDGRTENRLMLFAPPQADWCRDKRYFCSSAPVSARARLVITRDQLTFNEKVATDNRLDERPEVDVALRLLTVTGTRSWTLSLEAENQLLVLRPNLLNTSRLVANIPNRMFARIEPDRLRRLRALQLAHGVLAPGLSASEHWRCLLANATADEAAFAAIRTGQHASPKFLEGAMKVASYLGSLYEAVLDPDSEGPHAEKRGSAGMPLERLMTERFPDIRTPSTASERDALGQRYKTLMLRLRDESVAAPGIPLDDHELAAFARATGDDPEAKQLFCRK